MAETTTPKKRGRKAAAAGQPVTQEVVVMVPLAELHPFPDHPFQVRDNESMRETAASVKENGVIIPGLVRPGRRAVTRSSRATGVNTPVSWLA